MYVHTVCSYTLSYTLACSSAENSWRSHRLWIYLISKVRSDASALTAYVCVLLSVANGYQCDMQQGMVGLGQSRASHSPPQSST